MLAPLVRGRLLAASRVARTFHPRRYKSNEIRCEPHMNELPIPCGPFHIYYKDRQAFYNRILAGGIICWVIGLAVMIGTGSFYLNWGPPANPGPPSDMIDECEDVVKK